VAIVSIRFASGSEARHRGPPYLSTKCLCISSASCHQNTCTLRL